MISAEGFTLLGIFISYMLSFGLFCIGTFIVWILSKTTYARYSKKMAVAILLTCLTYPILHMAIWIYTEKTVALMAIPAWKYIGFPFTYIISMVPGFLLGWNWSRFQKHLN